MEKTAEKNMANAKEMSWKLGLYRLIGLGLQERFQQTSTELNQDHEGQVLVIIHAAAVCGFWGLGFKVELSDAQAKLSIIIRLPCWLLAWKDGMGPYPSPFLSPNMY